MDDVDFRKLPLKDRCAHKQWKARVHGYEEVIQIFRRIEDGKSQEWVKFMPLIKKMVVDANINAQEKGLEATLVFLDNCALAGKIVGDLMYSIIQKCIAAPKPKTKSLSVQIALMYIEIGKHEAVVNELVKGMEHKNPKVAAACVATATLALHEFGNSVVNVQPLFGKLSQLISDRDIGVRASAKQLAVELYKWVGPALVYHISSLPEITIKDLQDEFKKVKDEKVQPVRLLKSQQRKLLQQDVEGDIGYEADPFDQDAIDQIEQMESIDLLSKIPKNFYKELQQTKWSLRKKPLEFLEKLLNTHRRLDSGDYSTLVITLKNIVAKDPHVVLVTLAGRCMAMLAKSLGKQFSPLATGCVFPLLEKFKEKNPHVLAAIREAIDAIYAATGLEAIHEHVVKALNHKSTNVKCETASFLARAFSCTHPVTNKKMLKTLSIALVKTLNEPYPNVRNSAAQALGTLCKLVGERAMLPHLDNIDAFKMAKIKEYQKKAVIRIIKCKPAAATPAKTISSLPRTPSEAKNTRRITTAVGPMGFNPKKLNRSTVVGVNASKIKKTPRNNLLIEQQKTPRLFQNKNIR